MRTFREEQQRIHRELEECVSMSPEYVAAHGGEAMRRMGIADWIMEEVLLLDSATPKPDQPHPCGE